MAAEVTDALRVESVEVHYGGVTALDRVSLDIASGSVVGLIGPNGAGKTTLVNAITGVTRPHAGTIRLGTRVLDRLPVHARARAGLARTYQNIRLFSSLSIAENIAAGTFAAGAALEPDATHRIMRRVGMEQHAVDRSAGTLPYGEQRRLEIARSLAGRPHVLLLDEPAAGMNPREADALGDLIRSIAIEGTGVLLIEHDMGLVSSVCDRVVVLNFGSVIAEGTPAAIARDPAVVEAYLGSGGGTRS